MQIFSRPRLSHALWPRPLALYRMQIADSHMAAQVLALLWRVGRKQRETCE